MRVRVYARVLSRSDESDGEDIDWAAADAYSILSVEKRRQYSQVFQSIDENGDGTLSIDELQSSLASINRSWGSAANDATSTSKNSSVADANSAAAASTGAGEEVDSETQFIQTLLGVQKDAAQTGLDFKTFCIIVALSEQSEGLEVIFDGLELGGNNKGPEAMNAKVEVAKDLFQMLEPDSHGNVRMEQVQYALMAGNIAQGIINGIMGNLCKSADEAGGQHDIISFMEVLQYLPVFAEAHSHAKKTDSIF